MRKKTKKLTGKRSKTWLNVLLSPQVILCCVVGYGLLGLAVCFFYLDAVWTDWSGLYGFQLRQSIECHTMNLSEHQGQLLHGKAFALNNTGQVATLLVCAACSCPLTKGSLWIGGHTAELQSQWQSGETGDFKKIKPFDVFIMTWALPPNVAAGSDVLVIPHGTSSGGLAHDLGQTMSIENWRPGMDGSPLEGPQMVVCTDFNRYSPDVSERLGAAFVKHMVPLGVDLFRIYLVTFADEPELADRAVDSMVQALQQTSEGVPVEVIVPDWLVRGMDLKIHQAGVLWNMNDCLYSSKARGAEFVLYLESDEYPSIGSFTSLAQMAEGYDAVTFSSVRYSVRACFGMDLNGVDPLKMMPCRSRYAECDGELSKVLLRGLEDRCLGPRGRRKYIVRASAVTRLQVHSFDANPVRVKHTMEHEGIYVRHFRGLKPVGESDRACSSAYDAGTCSDQLCHEADSAYLEDPTCDTPQG